MLNPVSADLFDQSNGRVVLFPLSRGPDGRFLAHADIWTRIPLI